MARVVSAQPTTYHPTITSISPRDPTPGQTVTITGSDLRPPTWTVQLIYEDKYGSSTPHFVTLSGGSNTTLTFSAPANLRPDSIAIQYSNASTTDRLNNPIPQEERFQFLPSIHVQQPPDVDSTGFINVSNVGGGTFRVFLTSSNQTVKGKNLLKIPANLPTTILQMSQTLSLTRTDIRPTNLQSFIPLNSTLPTATFAGVSISVASARYVPNSRDEAVISTASLASNVSGFIKLTTGLGADSVRASSAGPPQNARVVEVINGTASAVANNQLVRGRPYEIRGTSLALFQFTGPNSVSKNKPTVRVGGAPIDVILLTASNGNPIDTAVIVSVPLNSSGITGGALDITHAGGSVVVASVTVINPPPPLTLTGVVVTPNDIIGGTSATVTVSLNPTPANFSTAGTLKVNVPASLAAAIPAVAPIAITANPMTFSLPTNVIQSTASGSIQVQHNIPNGSGQSVAISVRPPRPTAIAVAPDTIPGGISANGTVSFDLPGAATVLLSSSDPSTLTVPASVTRNGNTASFTITTQPVATPRSITITAALNGVTASKTVVVEPGRLTALSVSPTTVTGGEPVTATLSFSVPVTGAPVTFASSDTALRIGAGGGSVTGASKQFTLSTSPSLAVPANATLTVTANGISKSASVQINPIQLSQFTVSPASGAGGATLAATLKLSRPAIQQQFVRLTSSDTTVATLVNVGVGVTFQVGEDVKVVSILLRGPQAAPKTSTITAALHVLPNINAAVINSRTVTVTATP
jgi:hypothetical protein